MPVSTALIKWQQGGKHHCDLQGKQFHGGDARGEASADVALTQGSLHGHGSLQLVLAEPYHPQLVPGIQLPDPIPTVSPATEGNTLQRCHFEHSELNAQSLELK